MTELRPFYDKIKNLVGPEPLFGTLTGDVAAQQAALKHLFRTFAKVTHEDVYQLQADKVLARQAFVRLKTLFDLAVKRVDNHTYGTSHLLATIKTRKATYTVERPLSGGDLSSLYIANDGTNEVIVKISRSPAYNDLLANEAKTLHLLNTGAELTASFKHYIPTLIESVQLAGASRTDVKAVNILRYEPEWVPLTDVYVRYPMGVDPKHGVWMWKRLLSVLGFCHSLNIIHGAVLPSHILVNPQNHGVRLIDWSYSVENGQAISTICRQWKAFYPLEVLGKMQASPATDIFMAAKTIAWTLGDEGPRPILRFLESCQVPNPARRPNDAFALYEAFDKLANDLYGKPKFVPLTMEY